MNAIVRLGSVICCGVACAGVVGCWLGANVQCSVQSTPLEYVPCPLASEAIVLYLGLLTVVVVMLAVAIGLGNNPRLGSMASAILVAGALVFPTGQAFPNLANISGVSAPFLLTAMMVCGGSAGFLEPIRWTKILHGNVEPSTTIAFGSALIAFTSWAAYWLPGNLSTGSSLCHGPAGYGYCQIPQSPPLLPEVYSVGLVALGIGVAAPLFNRRLTELGLACGAGTLVVAVFGVLVEGSLFLVAVSIGVGSLVALTGLLARAGHVRSERNLGAAFPPAPNRRDEP